ncbi:MAG TPA: redoxin domain-containing protein [Pirellulales bacterium]|jgi:peroxiredoxin|nr:redoxin domain-containing protein [Pirellulales bacterium]
MRWSRYEFLGGALSLAVASLAGTATAASPSAEDALQLQPVQKEVEIDRPASTDAAKCTIKAEQIGGATGWIVRNSNGQILRRFADTNNDNIVDQWCYYLGGIEVYRDIDQNFNGKADQYRWLNTAGTRWALDTNEDGKIDSWKAISAEEVSAELVRAIGSRDTAQFGRLLVSSEEIGSLGLGSEQAKKLATLVDSAPDRFKKFLTAQKSPGAKFASMGNKVRWVHFGGWQPGLVPAGTNGSTKDVVVYENVAAMVQIDGQKEQNDQIPIGTLVKIAEGWRLIDSPPIPGDASDTAAAQGFFYPSELALRPETPAGSGSEGDAKVQEWVAKLEKLDKQIMTASPSDQARLNAERADLVEQIASLNTGDDRKLWIRQLADTISAAAQTGAFPDGVQRLKSLHEKLDRNSDDADLAAFVEFRYLTADYGSTISQPNADFVTIQKKWLDSLNKYVTDHPTSPDTAEAMLQLGIAQEFAGQEDEAKNWYGKIVDGFRDAPAAKKAGGAKARLESVGKVIQLSGKSITGQQVSLGQFRGKVVVLYYWATWSEPCLKDLATLRELQAKYARDGLAIVGISLDNQANDLTTFMKTNKLPWQQVYEPGGLDSPLANALGILTLPSVLLIDKQGKVVNRNVHVGELDKEVGALLR